MKLILFFVISCLALHNGKGAPKTAVYKFLRCNPNNQANCVTQKSPEMAWRPDLPAKLPASAAQYLDAEPDEGESPPREDGVELRMEEEETPSMSEQRDVSVQTEDGSGGFEGSAAESTFMADWAFVPAERDAGSGESRTEEDGKLYKVGVTSGMRRLFPSRSLVGEAKPAEQELKEDHLLQL
ncbi:hypothetical protein EPR50_G00005730 [Perca flavescens]|uniref:Serglycin n=1 Tax=Perca flavescens TaxID=8167 RepID=A0A484DP84_PERFV|nr:hypothetical protein EPR50_G00005730 [Perca flavescens]